MATRKIRDLNPTAKAVGYDRYTEYKNLLMNALQVIDKQTGKPLDFVKERILKNNLIECGAVGYDRMADKWAQVYGMGINEEGNPTTLTFVFPNHASYSRPAYYQPDDDGAYMIVATPDAMPMGTIIKATTDVMHLCDKAIRQNLIACQTPFMAVVRDKDLRLSFLQAIQQKEEGEPAVVISSDMSEGVKGIKLETEYMVDKFKEYREAERDMLFNKLGIMSANIDKRERVQVGEVNATVGQCSDYIYMLIDTFNKQCETYGLAFEMQMNGSLEELYEQNAQPDGADADALIQQYTQSEVQNNG